MPVLDANALKRDPKGAAFLLRVLCRQPSPKDEPARLSTRVLRKVYLARSDIKLPEEPATSF
ncbi:hypothetical protein [Microvirga flavescens]|uniref:hypothetical protein n=1 Tax=Microvirga flavescens TaxID=2249811 RepID=UPI000DD9A543|nr:hypothetical protein [Microvirga flavescens]